MQSHQRIGKQDDVSAVSPVIATVLLLAITVSLSSMVFLVIADQFTGIEKQPITGRLSARAVSDGFQVVRVVDLDTAIAPIMLEWQVIPIDAPLDSVALAGRANDPAVYGTVDVPVAYHDLDGAYSVNIGDYFVIDTSLSGTQNGTWRFTLFDHGSNSKVASITLPAPNTAATS